MLNNLNQEIQKSNFDKFYGTITQITGSSIESIGPKCKLGELCYIDALERKIPCEVIGFQNKKTILMPFEDILGVSTGNKVYATGDSIKIKLGEGLKGQVVNALGNPLECCSFKKDETRSIYSKPIPALQRKLIDKQISTGVKAIDTILPLGEGQRIGIFAGSGVGKSTLLGMLAKYGNSDVNVIALIGERGREVQEFIVNELGEEGMKNSIVVVATSDEPALMRIKAAFTATTIAEYFRDKGQNVVLMMDSVTRVGMAQREVGIATGEKVAQRGYTPSVFALLPKLLERAGTSPSGTITGIYTVLVDGGDMDEPIADTTRGILDGHIILSRELANKGHFPAIDILQSISRVTHNICDSNHIENMNSFRELLANYAQIEDLVTIGAYKRGQNKDYDRAVDKQSLCMQFLKQQREEYVDVNTSISMLHNLVGE